MKTIEAVIKKPGMTPYRTQIRNTLHEFQKAVDGYIEVVQLLPGLAVVCNEEGRLNGMVPNCLICGEIFHGPIVFVGTEEDQFVDLPLSWTQFQESFNWLFDKELNEEIAYDTV